MKNLKELTLEQLENQYSAINAARFLMERNYDGSETTSTELLNAMNQIENEIIRRKN